MLFTRCPDCDTTFRVTDDALNKANGQVRCGRCASVFNAYAERRDGPAEPAPASPGERESPAAVPSAAAPTAASSVVPQTATAPAPAPATSAPAKNAPLPSVKIAHVAVAREPTDREPPLAAAAAARPASDDPFGAMSVAEVVAQVELGAADETADTGEIAASFDDDRHLEGISPSEVQQVLEGESAVPTNWSLEAPEPRRRRGVWMAGSALAFAVLAAQGVHHYRAELVSAPAVGSLVKITYEMLGAAVVPHWDIHQYEILDWIATAEPNTRGKGSLRITARIKNRGPQYQPYPSVKLRLKDRWEEALGSRVFSPAEYLAAPPRKLMAPGETTRAEFDVVDPGQDAYGFELDVCIEVETDVLSCGSDKVFL